MNDSTKSTELPRRHWLTPAWLVLLLLGLSIIALAVTGDAGRTLLRYDRSALLDQHQYWRLLTGHLVHGSWRHTWLNLAGLALIVVLFRDTYTPRQWSRIALGSALFIDIGLLYLMPQLAWYVGLSGVLHGLLAAGAGAWWRVEDWRLAAALSAILIGKLGWEQWQGALPLSGELNVIVNAHLYGAVGGLVMALLIRPRFISKSAHNSPNQ